MIPPLRRGASFPTSTTTMTRSMNPLKAFVYASAGVPIVSTPVANLSELEELITIAAGADEFEAAIEAALTRPRGAPRVDLLEPHSWDRRVDDVLTLIDRRCGRRFVVTDLSRRLRRPAALRSGGHRTDGNGSSGTGRPRNGARWS